MASDEKRRDARVEFTRGIQVYILAIDGTWRRPCIMNDVSETGAKLTTETSIGGLVLKEFFLLLSTTGLAFRRCELAWVNGDQFGVNFLKSAIGKKKPRPAGNSNG
jgi:hypothetical protein